VVRSETVEVMEGPTTQLCSPPTLSALSCETVMTRAERAHWRLSWEQRLARNARPSNAPQLVITLHGLPTTFASIFGFDLLATVSPHQLPQAVFLASILLGLIALLA
jgi:hypothetical protein